MIHKPSGRRRHSYIQFYMADWLAGTARMQRIVRSIYFDVCCYNWDKAAAVPQAELFLMLGDVDSEQAESIIKMLLASNQLEVDEQDCIFSPRALEEGKRALAAWEAKSAGGRGGKHLPTPLEHTSEASSEATSTELEPELEPHKKKGGNPPSSRAKPKPTAKAKKESVTIPVAAKAMIPQVWNEVAAANGLSQISTMTAARKEALDLRIKEHGVNALLDGIRSIPNSPFLIGKEGGIGWKANFDWLMQTSSCAKLIEGTYHNKGRGKDSGWTG